MARKRTIEAPKKDEKEEEKIKLKRNEAKEIKDAERYKKKIERRKLEEEENLLLSSNNKPVKVTRYQIEMQREKASRKKIISPWEKPIPENPNRIIDTDVEQASSVQEAIELFKEINNQKLDSYMSEERIRKLEKIAYQSYVRRMLPILKDENPYMRHTQLLNLGAKNWRRSPENSFKNL